MGGVTVVFYGLLGLLASGSVHLITLAYLDGREFLFDLTSSGFKFRVRQSCIAPTLVGMLSVCDFRWDLNGSFSGRERQRAEHGLPQGRFSFATAQ
ncbi:MAG: hypothetical protein M2R45_02748 [Verrucomicrobia subdivision 3 bacterium]|nr:hypothetical protein [Limisphaerales bacterium]MCS1414298.1 hypothetical protein [Limisphaerales bacterium]